MNTATVSIALPATAPMSTSRLLGAYVAEARHEITRTLTTPAYLVPTIALPVMLYLLFGVLMAKGGSAVDVQAGLRTLSGFVMFSVIGPGIFGLGIGFAIERQSGIVTLKRALPMPPAANLIGKLLCSMTMAFIVIVLLMIMATTLGHVALTAPQIAKMMLVSVLGVAPFCALGLLIGTLVSGTAAPAVVNLIYFPMIYLSGLFPFPLPKAMQVAARVWPAFHLNQLSLASLGSKTAMDVRVSATVLVVFTVVCLALATRRLARVG
jgi:ABC-2 type transport system permease protein